MAQAQRSTHVSMQGIAGSLALARTALFAFSVAAVAAFAVVGKNAIKAAMDVVESESLFTVSMGSMGAAARQWSEDLQSSLGLNAYEVRRNVGVFYNMTTSMGLARKEAYKLSTELTELAYDMASFYNMPVEEMFVKLQSGITGETEPLKRIGILVLDNVIKQYAYAEGIANVGDELTEQQKVMARYIAIMAQTRNAQGDLARTIMSPTNQLRLLRMQLQLANINLGNAFMPIVSVVLPILTGFAKGLVRVTNTFAQFMTTLFGTNNAQAQNAQSAADAAAAQSKLGKATKKAGADAKKGVAGFDEIHQLQEDIAGAADDAANAMGSSDPTTEQPDKKDDKIKIPQEIVDMANKAREALRPIGDYFAEIGGMFKKFWSDIQPSLQPIVDFVVKVFGPVWEGLYKIIVIVFSALKEVIRGALSIIQGIFEVFGGLLTGNWKMMWEGIKDIASGVWTIITAVLKGAWAILEAEWVIFTSTMKIVWETVWNAIKDFAASVGEGIKTLVITVWTSISKFLSTSWEGIKTNSATTWTSIKESLSGAWGWISAKATEVFPVIRDTIINAFTTVGDVVKSIWEGIKLVIKDSFNFIIGVINNLIKGINNLNIKVPKIKGVTEGFNVGFNIEEFPKLAQGGIVSSPTLAMVGENNKKEVIVPLENTSFVNTIASAIGTAVLGAMQFAQPQQSASGSSGDIIIQIDSVQLARVAIPAINKEQGRIGNNVILQGV